jgi:hypothetical protein
LNVTLTLPPRLAAFGVNRDDNPLTTNGCEMLTLMSRSRAGVWNDMRQYR